MRKSWIAALAVPLAIAGIAGPAGADDSSHKPKPVPNEHVTITFTVSTPQGAGTVVATGPIAGTGTATAASKGEHHGRVRLAVTTLTFGADTVNVRAAAHGKRTLDAATCTTTETGKGAFQIRGGTGAYANAKGRGKFTVTSTIVGTKDAASPKGCNFKTPTGTIVIDATATVKI